MNPNRSTLIRNGLLVCEEGAVRQNVLIKGEKIERMGPGIEKKADLVVDADGLLVLPGAVDPHVHFNDEFMGTVSVHDYSTGTLAAAYGGVTSVIDFSNQAPGASLMSTLETKFREAEGKALVDWGVHPVITRHSPEVLDEIPRLMVRGAPTFKCYMTYRSEGLMMEEPELRQILARLKDTNGMLMLHAEDNDTIETRVPSLISEGNTRAIFHARSRPPETEDLAIRKAVHIAKETGGRVFVVHLASGTGLDIIKQARAQGTDILCETCTHYLIFTEAMLERDDGIKWICSPPLRDESVQQALWSGLEQGHISQVSSDDAAFSWEAKLLGRDRFDLCPNGIPGIEVRLPMLYSEGVTKDRISLSQWVSLVSTMPARLFGLFPQKGTIAPGSDADLVLFDPEERWTMGLDTLHMAADWSAYEGIEVTGKVKQVFSRGELIIHGGECLARKGRGRYLHRRL
ncbi:MAG: dihydropyrimidinase [Candidatus Aminicenantaceae bacterium]